MERIYSFLPSVLIIAVIAGVAHFYVKWAIKRFGDNFKSVEWHRNNHSKVMWTVGAPFVNVLAPALEELVFRAPLIIAFSTMSLSAWYGVVISSGLFALVHWFGKKIWISDILLARENGNHKSDILGAEVKRLNAEEGKMVMMRKVLHIVFTLPLGILAGYYGIKYQSLWVAFGIHFAWNLIVPTLLQILVALVVIGTSFLMDIMRWRRRSSV